MIQLKKNPKWTVTPQNRSEVKRDFIHSLKGENAYCLACGVEFQPPHYHGLYAHHILVVEKFPLLYAELERFGYKTVVPLCQTCHNKVHWALNAYRKMMGKRV